MRVRYIAPFGIRTGYAQAAQDYLSALVATGVEELEISPLNEDGDSLEKRYEHLVDYVDGGLDGLTHQVVHTVPMHAHHFVEGSYDPGPGVKKVCVTTWETTSLPASIVETLLRAFHLIIVPSAWNRGVFIRSGIPPEKVVAVPHTFDPSFWTQAEDKRWTAGWKSPGPFEFYTIGVWGSRKNLVGTLLAYWHAFASGKDDVRLRILCPPPQDGELEALVARCQLDHYAPVELITTPMSDEELRAFHLSSHCFVSATRGEAWGLGAFEAAITGNLVIMPAFGGQTDFLRFSRWLNTPHQLTPVAPEVFVSKPVSIAGIEVRSMTKSAPNGLSAAQSWAEPDLVTLAHQMQRAVDGDVHPGALELGDLNLLYGYPTVGKLFKQALEQRGG